MTIVDDPRIEPGDIVELYDGNRFSYVLDYTRDLHRAVRQATPRCSPEFRADNNGHDGRATRPPDVSSTSTAVAEHGRGRWLDRGAHPGSADLRAARLTRSGTNR